MKFLIFPEYVLSIFFNIMYLDESCRDDPSTFHHPKRNNVELHCAEFIALDHCHCTNKKFQGACCHSCQYIGLCVLFIQLYETSNHGCTIKVQCTIHQHACINIHCLKMYSIAWALRYHQNNIKSILKHVWGEMLLKQMDGT